MTGWLLLPIVIAVGITTYDYRINPTGWYDLALFFFPLSICLTVFLWHKLPALHNTLPEQVSWQSFTRWQIGVVLLGLLCFVILAQSQGRGARILQFTSGMHHAQQFALFIVGSSLITIGMTGLSLKDIRQVVDWRHDPAVKWIVLLMIVGLCIRVIWLESAVHYYTDESNFVSAIIRLRDIPHTQIMNNISPVANFTWVYSYFTYYYTELLGATLANLRAISVIIGVLTIPAVYLLGRWGFNRRVGLMGVILLAVDLPHIHYSRLALNNIVDPLLAVLAIAFLWRGLQTGSRRMFALSGVFGGLTAYFYEGGRLLYPALIVSWLVIYSLFNNGKIHKRGIAVFVATALLIMSGFYFSLGMWGFQNVAPRLLQQRVQDNFWAGFFTSPDTLGQLSLYFDQRLNPPYLHIVSQGDATGFYYSDELSLVLPYLLPFFLIGVGASLYHWRGLGWILPLWIVLTILGNSLIKDNDWTARFVVVFPALILLTALGIETIYRSITQHWLRSERLLQIAGVSIFALIGVLQVSYYFAVMIPDYNVDIRIEIDDQDATYRAQSFSLGTEVYIIANDDRYHEDVDMLQRYERHTVPVNVVAKDDFDFGALTPTANRPYAFFILPDDEVSLNRLEQIFGNRLSQLTPSPHTVPLHLQYQLYQVNSYK